MTTTRRPYASPLVLCLVAAVTACGGGLVLPDESRPAKIVIVGGDAQIAPAGATLSQPLVVKVTDALDRPVEGQVVAFAINAGGGQVAPASAATDMQGQASAVWTLGAASGQQRVQALVGGSGDPLSVMFSASATSGSGALLELVSGNNQTAAVGSALHDSLVVRVTDALGNPVAGVEVQWAAGGGGSISPASVLSDAEGKAGAERVLGTVAGPQSAQASSPGLSPVVFTHTAQAANPTSLVMVSGDGQTGSVGAPLADSLVVRLVDGNGNGVGGAAISWVIGTGGGSTSPTTVSTTPSGFARTQWTLGPAAGSNLMNAVFSGLPSVPFSATATAGAAVKLAFTQPPVTSTAGSTIAPPVQVTVQDAGGNRVTSSTASVTIAIGTNPGGGTLAGTKTVAAVGGVASFSDLSIDKTGTGYTLTASAGGLTGATSPTFDILTGSANRLVFLTGPTDRQVGQVFSPALRVQVQDAGGNPVITALGQITLTSSVSGTLTGTATATPVAGTATFSNLAVNKADVGYTLTALASGVASRTSSAFDVTKGGTTIAITSKSPSGASVVGQSVQFNYDVNVAAPAAGTPTGSVTVTDGTQSCVGAINSSGIGSCSIAFSSAGSRNVTAAYGGDGNFDASSTAGPTAHTVNKANTLLVISGDAPDFSLVGQTVTVEWSLSPTGAGAGTPTGTVTVTAPGTGGCSAAASFGTGSCELVFPTIGTPSISASYPGDANFNNSSDNEPHTVKGSTSTTLGTSGSPATAGDDVTFTAQVAVTSGAGSPGGPVRFFDGSTQIGQSNLNGAGIATLTVNDLAVGSHSITAAYLGSSTFDVSTSAPLTQVIEDNNTAPTVVNDDYSVLEDGSLSVNAATGVLSNDSDEGPITAVLDAGPAHAQSFTLNPDGSFSYVPAADYNGGDSFIYHADDGALTSGTATVSITVTAVNDAPSFGSGGDVTAGIGAYSAAWATNGSPGPANESAQTLTYVTSVEGLGGLLFTAQPSVAPNGTLTFTALGIPGTATVHVHVQDSGGTANGGVDSSPEVIFTITIS